MRNAVACTSQNAPSHRDLYPHLIHGSLDPRESASLEGSSISLAVSAQLTICVDNIQTHRPRYVRHQTTVGIGRIYALRAGDAP